MYKVEKIISHRENPKKKGFSFHNLGKIEYLIKWEDWDSEFNTWEPPSHLEYVEEMIIEYRRANDINFKEKNLNKQTSNEEKPKKNSQGNVSHANNMLNKSGASDENVVGQEDTEKMRKRVRPTFHNDTRSKQNNIEERLSSLEKPKKKKIERAPKGESQESSFHKDQTNNSTTAYSSYEYAETSSLSNDSKKKITILGMKKDGAGFWYFVSDNGKESWVSRDYMITNYASCLCEFYENKIVFNEKEKKV